MSDVERVEIKAALMEARTSKKASTFPRDKFVRHGYF